MQVAEIFGECDTDSFGLSAHCGLTDLVEKGFEGDLDIDLDLSACTDVEAVGLFAYKLDLLYREKCPPAAIPDLDALVQDCIKYHKLLIDFSYKKNEDLENFVLEKGKFDLYTKP